MRGLTKLAVPPCPRPRPFQNAEGAGLAPFDCWLGLRGLKTMALRMERSADNCAKLAAYLSRHPLVKKVRPGCASYSCCTVPPAASPTTSSTYGASRTS